MLGLQGGRGLGPRVKKAAGLSAYEAFNVEGFRLSMGPPGCWSCSRDPKTLHLNPGDCGMRHGAEH